MEKVFPREVQDKKIYLLQPKIPKVAYIYKLTNQQEKVCYIGKTERTIEERLTEHIKENPLINKYDGKWEPERKSIIH